MNLKEMDFDFYILFNIYVRYSFFFFVVRLTYLIYA